MDDVAVFALGAEHEDKVWEEKIAVLLVLKQDSREKFNMDEFMRWIRLRVPHLSLPSKLRIVPKLSRNQS